MLRRCLQITEKNNSLWNLRSFFMAGHSHWSKIKRAKGATEAKAANMPRDTIEKAILKGTGELGGENYEAAVYEGYAPGGIALMIDALTNNRARTAPEIRTMLE